jgi:hypothetical protein
MCKVFGDLFLEAEVGQQRTDDECCPKSRLTGTLGRLRNNIPRRPGYLIEVRTGIHSAIDIPILCRGLLLLRCFHVRCHQSRPLRAYRKHDKIVPQQLPSMNDTHHSLLLLQAQFAQLKYSTQVCAATQPLIG